MHAQCITFSSLVQVGCAVWKYICFDSSAVVCSSDTLLCTPKVAGFTSTLVPLWLLVYLDDIILSFADLLTGKQFLSAWLDLTQLPS